jgi:hypothetical protein
MVSGGRRCCDASQPFMRGATMSSSRGPHRSGSASSEACFVLFGICLVLPYVHPEIVPSSPFWDCAFRVRYSPTLIGATSAKVGDVAVRRSNGTRRPTLIVYLE